MYQSDHAASIAKRHQKLQTQQTQAALLPLQQVQRSSASAIHLANSSSTINSSTTSSVLVAADAALL
jgi:hypothetical protein